MGMIGTGAFAEICHLPGLQAAGAEMVAIAGRRRERAVELATRFGIPHVCGDAAELVARDDVDAVAICTPNALHREQALLAFAHGKHVFCEKPLGASLADAEEMAAAAEASGRVHQVAFTYRYLHGVAELRRRVQAGDAGEPFRFRAHHEYWFGLRPDTPISWRERRDAAGAGVLFDTGSHLMDLARWLLGPVAAVQCALQTLPRRGIELSSGEERAVETDDLATCALRFASGAQGSWHASRITPQRADNHVQVVGRDGAFDALLSRGRLDRLRVLAAGESDWEEVALPHEAGRGGNHALTAMMASFVAACRRGALAEGDASFADGLAAQRLLDAAERSAGSAWVELTPPA